MSLVNDPASFSDSEGIHRLQQNADRIATRIWISLVLATALIWWIGGSAGSKHRAAIAAILVIAICKVQLVMHVFMETRFAPVTLRLVLGGWTLTVFFGVLLFLWRIA